MKVTVTFEETSDDLGNGWSSNYTQEGVETAEDFLWAIGQASKTVFDFNNLTARQDYIHSITGDRKTNKFSMDF